MKYLFFISCVFVSINLLSQNTIFGYLDGNWKIGASAQFEQWNKLNDSTLMGFSYKMKNGKIVVSEYLEISLVAGNLVYRARVIGQNNGNVIEFKQIDNDSMWIFENLKHDFPKRIVYKKLTKNEMQILVKGDKGKGFEYKMQRTGKGNVQEQVGNTDEEYDEQLAKQLGADDYGMKNYVLVILKTGSNTTKDTAIIQRCFRSHFENISFMEEAGQLIVAGPLGKNLQNYRGIFILEVANFDEAKRVLEGDEAIKEQLLEAELFHWYGSAALAEYLHLARKIQKIKL